MNVYRSGGVGALGEGRISASENLGSSPVYSQP